jgi:ArsR family transcriptional regulator, arsenate/arsenite/antimonite-responsive transcriptional repressor
MVVYVLCYLDAMPIRPRPVDCCSAPAEPANLTEAERSRLVGAFRALGDPTRFEIFRLIAAQESPICVCDIVERFELRQPTISYHLKLLREAGLVTASQRGVWAYYSVEAGALALLEAGLGGLRPRALAGAR